MEVEHLADGDRIDERDLGFFAADLGGLDTDPGSGVDFGQAVELFGQIRAQATEASEVVGLHHEVTDELLAEDLADLSLQRGGHQRDSGHERDTDQHRRSSARRALRVARRVPLRHLPRHFEPARDGRADHPGGNQGENGPEDENADPNKHDAQTEKQEAGAREGCGDGEPADCSNDHTDQNPLATAADVFDRGLAHRRQRGDAAPAKGGENGRQHRDQGAENHHEDDGARQKLQRGRWELDAEHAEKTLQRRGHADPGDQAEQ